MGSGGIYIGLEEGEAQGVGQSETFPPSFLISAETSGTKFLTVCIIIYS
jgi:hypothetical protein